MLPKYVQAGQGLELLRVSHHIFLSVLINNDVISRVIDAAHQNLSPHQRLDETLV